MKEPWRRACADDFCCSPCFETAVRSRCWFAERVKGARARARHDRRQNAAFPPCTASRESAASGARSSAEHATAGGGYDGVSRSSRRQRRNSSVSVGGAQRPQPRGHPLVGERAQLLWHREARLAQAALRRRELEIQRVPEVGARQRDGEREAERGAVELVDRDDHEPARLSLLGAARRIPVGPDDLAPPRRLAQYAGVDASKASSSAASPRYAASFAGSLPRPGGSPANPRKPTRGLEPRTPSLRDKEE
jgi:hypothetical protein